MIKNIFYCLCFLTSFSTSAIAQNITAASIFGDNMVLQQGINAPIWGTSKPNQDLTLSFAGNTLKTKSSKDGKWMVKLPKLKAGGPLKMVITSAQDSLVFKYVLVGEVWLASGQSNMQMKMAEINNAQKEINEAKFNKIRFFNVALNISHQPIEQVKGSWKLCNPENAKQFSAAAYFFARDLHLDQNVPVGIISASWGATPSEAWTSSESLINHPDFKDSVKRYQKLEANWELLYSDFLKTNEARKSDNTIKAPVMPVQKNYPTALYNAMIAPIVPYGIKGVIWYQGENNSTRAVQYRSLFPLLINDWRNKWNDEKMPFIFVQLANFRVRNEEPIPTDSWTMLREAQTMALKLPYTGMAVAIDIGDAKDIHPKNKQDVGKRLYLAASHVAYNKSVVYSGPIYDGMIVNKDKAEVSFKHVGKGLTSNDGPLTAFEIAGADKKFYWADAEIVGDKIVLSSKEVSKPVAVRYAWSTNPAASLFNKEGLPASPFRTDDW
ncbi:sialate O-acetylesterase [Pedobacter cryophilus]|uniref:Sialate O-acetylesterase n=1 Tax=Pedobacter cryophilus TaxID=2571271 RepID=A0A4U1C1I7_9SPHI|nr:sialate O-acetylesterase [Pedobacter cryophilus]TKB99081.1 sialate O-acetylesterase [Pedobacter cryophilus]